MHQFEVHAQKDGVRVNAIGSTRAGLLTAAVEGMCAASQPRWKEDAKETTRSFSITTPDFSTLLVQLLDASIAATEINREAYSTVRFTLITDAKAEGAFVGKGVAGVETKIASVGRDVVVTKNADGNWETTIAFGA